MKLWTLMENTACREDLTAEHGLSLYLETGNRNILFDAGQSDCFADNAEKMGVDLRQADLAVLSHGHYDHSGGLLRFLEINRCAKIYVNRFAVGQQYHGQERYIGVDPALWNSDRIVYVEETMDLGQGMSLCACNEKEKSHPVDSFGLTVYQDGEYKPDLFLHEQYLLVEEEGKRILISGCSHKGILNIVDWYRPDVLIGGFHFMKLDPEGEGAEKLRRAAMELLRYDTVYYTGHCTGEAQFAFMKTIMGDRLRGIAGGSYLEL